MTKQNEHGVRHITPAGANIFLELGFEPQEAEELQRQSQAEIAQALKLKQQLMSELSDWMTEQQLKQAQAASILGVSRPRVSDVVNRKTSRFTIDALVNMLARTGKTVTLSVQ